MDEGKKRKVKVKLLSWEADLDAEGQWLVYFPVQMTISVEGFTNKQEIVLDETMTVRISEEEVCIVSGEEEQED